jgi:hypothetical protein
MTIRHFAYVILGLAAIAPRVFPGPAVEETSFANAAVVSVDPIASGIGVQILKRAEMPWTQPWQRVSHSR